jgi:hypothetical protein
LAILKEPGSKTAKGTSSPSTRCKISIRNLPGTDQVDRQELIKRLERSRRSIQPFFL